MAEQKTPHDQSQQNRNPEETDREPEQLGYAADDAVYSDMEGAETGTNRTSKKLPTNGPQHRTEPEAVAHEGSVTTRTPKRPAQGITSHSVAEESERQKKVVNERPDAEAGVNHSR